MTLGWVQSSRKDPWGWRQNSFVFVENSYENSVFDICVWSKLQDRITNFKILAGPGTSKGTGSPVYNDQWKCLWQKEIARLSDTSIGARRMTISVSWLHIWWHRVFSPSMQLLGNWRPVSTFLLLIFVIAVSVLIWMCGVMSGRYILYCRNAPMGGGFGNLRQN